MQESKNLIILWISSIFILALFSSIGAGFLIKILTPLVITLFLLLILKNLFKDKKFFTPYLFFFSISITSAFGITQALTGSHSESPNPYLYGLSFYTASIAFYLATKKSIHIKEAFKFSNPLILATGPIALYIDKIRYKSFKKRVNYYLPFIFVGFFFFQIIASPLTNFFFLIENVDLVAILIFAFIFEIFVYANFCGLSLIIYGVFGILGYKIPLNFKQPFSSLNVIDFWKGWHTSLSAVLKELFYKPVRKRNSYALSLLVVFCASALWHGVSLNFLIWGLFHSFVFWITLLLLRNNIRILPTVIMIFGVVIGRMIFADNNTERLLEKLTFSYDGVSAFELILNAPTVSLVSLSLGLVFIMIEFFFQKNNHVRKRNYKHLRSPISIFLLTLITVFLITSTGGDYAVYGQR